MKRKRVRAKTKTKSYEQIKNFAIAILALVVLIVIAINVQELKIGSSKAAVPGPGTSILSTRDWPSMAPKPTSIATADPGGTSLPSGPGPTSPPNPLDIQTPYAFVKAVGNNSYGPVYYSPGGVLPTLLFAGNAMTPVPSGSFVFTIRVDATMPGGFPSRTTPIKINTTTGAVTALAASGDYPRMWNYLVPADNGNDYLYSAISLEGADVLTGPIYIIDNGVPVWSAIGSYLQPTLSADGIKAAWCYKSGNQMPFGNRDAYIFDVATKTTTKIKDVGADQECIGPSITSGGTVAAFTLGIYVPGVGLYDQEVWYKPFRSSTSEKVSITGYRWNSEVEIAHTYVKPEDLKLVWHANKDPGLYHGYNILCATLPAASPGSVLVARELTIYSANLQKLWPDVDPNGFVVFSNEISSHSNYAMNLAHTNFPRWTTQIINLNAINRDVSFKN